MKKFFQKIRTRLQHKKALSDQQKISDMNKKLVFSQSGKKIPGFSQLRYIFTVFSRKERTVFFSSIFIIFASVVFLGVHFYVSNTEVVPVSGGSYSEALIGLPQYINPILSQTSDVDTDISRLVFSGLFTYNDDQELVPDLVNTYALTDDEKTYTFYMRQGVKWHDGQDFTADDVVFTISLIQDAEFKSPLAPSFKGVQIKKIDDYTLSMQLQEPFAPFISGLTFGILPEHLWFDIPAASANLAGLNLKPIGTGPFQFSSLTKDKTGIIKSYTLERFKDYYSKKPYLDDITFVFYADIFSAVDAMRQKDVKGIGFISSSDKQLLESKNRHLDFYSLRLPQYTAVFFNQNNKLLADKDIRHALALSFDRQRIINDALSGAGDIIYSPILPGYVGYNAEVEKYGFDPEKAGKILDEAGWVLLEGDTVRHKAGKELAFSITTVDQAEYLATLNILKESWEAIGIRIDLRIISSAEIQSRVIKPRDYEALLFGEIIGIDPDPYPFWHSSQSKHPGLNLAVFLNKNVDQLLEEARQTNDSEQRRVKYLHFQNILADELPAIFLYNPLYNYAISKDIHGVSSQYITVPADRFTDIENWYIKKDRIWKKSDDGSNTDITDTNVSADPNVNTNSSNDNQNTNSSESNINAPTNVNTQ